MSSPALVAIVVAYVLVMLAVGWAAMRRTRDAHDFFIGGRTLAKPAVIVNLMVMSWGTLAGVFLAPYLYGLFWRRTTPAGVWARVATGLGAAFLLFPARGADGVPLAGAVVMLVPLAVVPAVSLFTRAPEPALVRAAFGDGAEAPPARGEALSA
jgi:Na+/proline symporter